jgi:NAD(P)-dependent dehydrogenase (short-subunit alcohol dehydrogenase family)|tara:strand:- start:1076 stop:1810 length:735 start_codon:yes stop_codon:yes gene_type:complete
MKKVLIVTGGSRGIGHQTSILAAKAGWDVCINYNSNKTRAEQTAEAVRKIGKSAIIQKGDICNEDDVIRLFQKCKSDLGMVSGVVNSAGIVEPYCRVDEIKHDEIERLIRINITAMMLVARESVKHMSKKHGGEGGSIVFISSAASRIGAPNFCVPYAASKGAVDSFTWGMAQEVAGEGLRVNAVSPGVIDTEIQPEGRVAEVGPSLPMGRAGQPEEVAQSIIWLLSDEASYVTGTNIDVTGGR